MPILVQQSEVTAAYRRMYFHCVDAIDGLTAEIGEAAGQPQISLNGAAWGNTTNTLTAIGNGRYYVELVAATEVNNLGIIEGRYKSANTAESIGETLQVVPWDPYNSVMDANITQINSNSVVGNAATLTLKQLDIQNNAGDAVVIAATGGNGDGVSILGNGTGHGMNVTGGATSGNGLTLLGGAPNGFGLYSQGDGTGAGIRGDGGDSTGSGIVGFGAANGHGLLLAGNGSGEGISSTGGITGHGIHAIGGATSGNGIFAEAATEGDGISALAKGTDEHGIYAVGGDTSGNGIAAVATTDGDGIYASAIGLAKHGIYAIGGNITGSGIYATAGTSGDGITAVGTTNGNGMQLAGSGTGEGLYSSGSSGGKGGSINVALNTTLAIRTSDTIFTITAGSGDDNAYNNMVLALYDVSGTLFETKQVKDYTGASKTVEVDTAFTFVVAANDIVRIFQNSYAPTVAAGGGATAAEVWQYDVSAFSTSGQAGTYQISGGSRYG